MCVGQLNTGKKYVGKIYPMLEEIFKLFWEDRFYRINRLNSVQRKITREKYLYNQYKSPGRELFS